MAKNVILIGASGLIGNHLLQLLLIDNDIESVNILVRKSLNIQHIKLFETITDFNELSFLKSSIRESDIVFCTVGTTQAKVNGNKEAYRKVDFAIPVNTAKAANTKKASHFILVSAIGANSKSSSFYLQLKGQVEDAISEMSDISSIHFFQPSLLLGNRTELRPGEKIGQWLMPLFSFLTPRKYRAIEASSVAKAMLTVSKQYKKGVYRYDYESIKNLCETLNQSEIR